MREIKFRAWDSETKTMLEPQDLSQSVKHWTWLGELDVKPMQYTGLKDKNGVEIYEGDVLKHFWANYHIGNFLVRWDDEGFWDYGISVKDSEVIGNIYENKELLDA